MKAVVYANVRFPNVKNSVSVLLKNLNLLALNIQDFPSYALMAEVSPKGLNSMHIPYGHLGQNLPDYYVNDVMDDWCQFSLSAKLKMKVCSMKVFSLSNMEYL